jgi:hypothetical protein
MTIAQFPTPWRGLQRASTEPVDPRPLPISLLALQLLASAGETLATGKVSPDQVQAFGRLIRDIAREEMVLLAEAGR